MDGFAVQFLPPRECEHPLGESRAALGTLRCVIQQRHELRVIWQTFAHEFKTAEHRHQKVVEIMRDAASKVADRFHLLRLVERRAGLVEFYLGFPPFADVLGDLGKAEQRAGFIPQRIDDDMSPKAAAVLADTPAFFLEFSFAFRCLQRTLWLAGGAIPVGIKLRKMPADDLSRAVTLDALRAEIQLATLPSGSSI